MERQKEVRLIFDLPSYNEVHLKRSCVWCCIVDKTRVRVNVEVRDEVCDYPLNCRNVRDEGTTSTSTSAPSGTCVTGRRQEILRRAGDDVLRDCGIPANRAPTHFAVQRGDLGGRINLIAHTFAFRAREIPGTSPKNYLAQFGDKIFFADIAVAA